MGKKLEKSSWFYNNFKKLCVIAWTVICWYFLYNLTFTFWSFVGILAAWLGGCYFIDHYDELVNHKFKCLNCGKVFYNYQSAGNAYSFNQEHKQLNNKLCPICINLLEKQNPRFN